MAAAAQGARGLAAPPRPGRGGASSIPAASPQLPWHGAAAAAAARMPEPEPEPEVQPQQHSPQLPQQPLPQPAPAANKKSVWALCSSKPAEDGDGGSAPRTPLTGRHDVRQPLYGLLHKHCKDSYLSTWQPRYIELVPETGVLLVRNPNKQDIDEAPLEELARQLTGDTFDPTLVRLNDAGEVVRYNGAPVTEALFHDTPYEGTLPLRLDRTRPWNLRGATVEQERIGQKSVRAAASPPGRCAWPRASVCFAARDD
eukprot:COSAG06_NODE_3039_length_5928_cov_49.157145_6_plen_256_part_00